MSINNSKALCMELNISQVSSEKTLIDEVRKNVEAARVFIEDLNDELEDYEMLPQHLKDALLQEEIDQKQVARWDSENPLPLEGVDATEVDDRIINVMTRQKKALERAIYLQEYAESHCEYERWFSLIQRKNDLVEEFPLIEEIVQQIKDLKGIAFRAYQEKNWDICKRAKTVRLSLEKQYPMAEEFMSIEKETYHLWTEGNVRIYHPRCKEAWGEYKEIKTELDELVATLGGWFKAYYLPLRRYTQSLSSKYNTVTGDMNSDKDWGYDTDGGVGRIDDEADSFIKMNKAYLR